MMTCYLTQYKIGFVLNLSTSYSRSRKGKNTRIKCQLQSCKVTAKILQNRLMNTIKVLMAQDTGTENTQGHTQGHWHFQWLHQRMPRREQRSQLIALYQFDIDVHLQESSCYN